MDVSVFQILSHTPPGVFILLAYLVWIGIKRLQPGVRPFARVWITPGIFIVWGIVGLFRREGDFSAVLTHWTLGALAGGVLGLAKSAKIAVDRRRQLVQFPGSALPLLRILVIFGAHYVLQVAAALHPDQRAQYLTWDTYVSGAAAGYFLGWSIRFLQAYRTAPQVELGASPGPLKA
jgi:hypothetical protein